MNRKTKLRLAFSSGLLLAYVILFWIVGLADYFILHPSTDYIKSPATQDFLETPPGYSAGKLELYRLPSRAAALPGTSPQAIVLEFIPNAGRAEYANYGADDWAFLPVEYISLNYPGYGASQGKPTLTNAHKSALATFDALRAANPNKPIFLSAMSLGTPVALHVAAQRQGQVAGLILQNPVPLKQLIIGKFGWWNLWLAAGPIAFNVPNELDAIKSASQVKAPAIFLLAQQDTFVLPKYQQQVLNAYAGPKTTINFPGHHNSPLEGPALADYRQALLTLWSQTISPIAPTTLPTDLKLP